MDTQKTDHPRHALNPGKAIESTLYLVAQLKQLNRSIDINGMLALIYQADKLHLKRWGRLIYGEVYTVSPAGALPVYMKAIMDVAAATLAVDFNPPPAICIDSYNYLYANRNYNRALLARSEVECLSVAVSQYENMDANDFLTLTKNSAWRAASAAIHPMIEVQDDVNGCINNRAATIIIGLPSIALAAGGSDLLAGFLEGESE